MTRKSVLDEIKKKLEVHSIEILGNRKDKAEGFYIIISTQPIYSDRKNILHGITNDTLELLKKAEIKFKIIK